MNAIIPDLSDLAGDALVVLLHLAAALSHLREGNVNSAIEGMSRIVKNGTPGRYVNEAQYWRGRIAETHLKDVNAKSAALRDYVDLANRLQEGPLKRELRVRIAALTEPGRLLSTDKATAASARMLKRIGRALHDYAADHGGGFPPALYDLLDDYISDPQILVRPGKSQDGGGKSYAYRPGLRADISVRPGTENAKALKVDGIPAIAWEPVDQKDGLRLVLCIDGSVRAAKMSQKPKPKPKQ